MLKANPPEQLVSTLLSSGSTKGRPTRAFNLIMDSLSPSESKQATWGAGADRQWEPSAGHPRTAAGMATNPGAVASAINRLVPMARNAIPRGAGIGGDVDALRLVSQRIGQVNQFQNAAQRRRSAKRCSRPAHQLDPAQHRQPDRHPQSRLAQS
jgi:hypothetical protein